VIIDSTTVNTGCQRARIEEPIRLHERPEETAGQAETTGAAGSGSNGPADGLARGFF
jgi:hypothetical protein